MAVSELVYYGGSQLAALIRAGEVSPSEVVTAFLERIEAVDPRLNAFISVNADPALERAARLERQRAAMVPQKFDPSNLHCYYPPKELATSSFTRKGKRPRGTTRPTSATTSTA